MKSDYWNVSNEQVIEKTQRPIDHWMMVLTDFNASGKKSGESVSHLQNAHGVPRYWARTLVTLYGRRLGGKF